MIFVLYLIHSVPKEITPVCPTLVATLNANDAASLRPFQHALSETSHRIYPKIIYEPAHILSWICLSASVGWNIDCPDRIVSSYCVDRGELFLLAVQLLLLRQ